MYHHHSQQRGPPQPSSSTPGPTCHHHNNQQQQQQQQRDHCMYPPPSHLPDELVSAFAASTARGSVDVDLFNRQTPHQMPGSGRYYSRSNQLDHQQQQQQGMTEWSDYGPHASPPSAVTQRPQSGQSVMGDVCGPASSLQSRGSRGDGEGVDNPGLYTSESKQSILATAGLSNEDFQFLSQFPEDRLNADTLPFILRFLQANKSSNARNCAASSSLCSPSASSSSGAVHNTPQRPGRSSSSPSMRRPRTPEVPAGFPGFPQTAGQVIDYGHASRATGDGFGGESVPGRRRARPNECGGAVEAPDIRRSSFKVHENKRPPSQSAREPPPPHGSRYLESSSRHGSKRPCDDSARCDNSARRKPPSSASRSPVKSDLRPAGSRRTKPESSGADETSAKGPSAKKMKEASPSTTTKSDPPRTGGHTTQSDPPRTTGSAARLLYLTGIPAEATEQDVKTRVGCFGKYSNVVLLSGSEADALQKASVCMEREKDALALARCSSLSIRGRPITATVAKKPEADPSTTNTNGKSSSCTQEASASVLLSGLVQHGCTESDVIKLCRMFGAPPTDVILARKLGKALVLMPHVDMAMKISGSGVKMKINDSDLKIRTIEQAVSLNTPVALYNILNEKQAHWNRLLVVHNVPDTPAAASDVRQLVARFGKVLDTLVLNHNTIICETEIRVRHHFHSFPCVLQGNPLHFTSNPDPTLKSQVYGPRWPAGSGDSFKDQESPADDDGKDACAPLTARQVDALLGKSVYLEPLRDLREGKVYGFHCKLCNGPILERLGGVLSMRFIRTHLNGERHKSLAFDRAEALVKNTAASWVEEYAQIVEEVSNGISGRRFYCHLCKCYTKTNGRQARSKHLKAREHVAALVQASLDRRAEQSSRHGAAADAASTERTGRKDRGGDVEVGGRTGKDECDIWVGDRSAKDRRLPVRPSSTALPGSGRGGYGSSRDIIDVREGKGKDRRIVDPEVGAKADAMRAPPSKRSEESRKPAVDESREELDKIKAAFQRWKKIQGSLNVDSFSR